MELKPTLLVNWRANELEEMFCGKEYDFTRNARSLRRWHVNVSK